MKSRFALLCLAIAGLSSCVSTKYQPPVKLRIETDDFVPYAYVHSTCTESLVIAKLTR
jgi:hypothetical protein